jgi:universal stress protein A
MQPITTILHPSDFSACSEAALKMAQGLARGFGARLVALHVGARPLSSTGGAMVVPPQPEELGREELTARLGKMVADDAGVRCETQVVFGETTDEILRAAERLKADLIVMGTHGRTGLHRAAMGSIAEQVVRRADCPVVTVRGRRSH